MAYFRKINRKGEVIIPKEIRDSFNLTKGSKIIFRVKENRIVLIPQEAL